MLYAALSCLQGHRADLAAADLARYADGIQLTPGCAPHPGIDTALAGIATRTHHGYTPTAMRRRIWNTDGTLAARADSIHPPKASLRDQFFDQIADGTLDQIAIEIMYAGYVTGNSADIHTLLDAHHPIALDVSHLWIQINAGTIDDDCVQRLYSYDNIVEIHLSANDGRRDSHAPIDTDTYALGWTAERLADGADVIIESYLQRVPPADRHAPFEMVRHHLDH